MQRTTDEVWVSFGVSDEHRLRYGLACGIRGETTLFRFEPGDEPASPVEIGAEVQLYYHGATGFLLQPATVVSREDDEDGPTYGMAVTGEAAFADDRVVERVDVPTTLAEATIGEKDACRLLDISETGVSISAECPLARGQATVLAFGVDNETYVGVCRVASVSPGPTAGPTRYGLRIDGVISGGNLAAGIRRLMVEIQKRRASRLSRAG